MAKIGENVPLLIDKAVDFMASSQAFREYLNKMPPRNYVPSEVPLESAPILFAASGILPTAVPTKRRRRLTAGFTFERPFLS
nr:Putative cytoplasmic protein [Salmonella sp. NCTC 7297]